MIVRVARRGRLFITTAVTLGFAAAAALQSGASGATPAQSARPGSTGLASAAVRHAYPDPPTGSTAVANLGATGGWKVLTSATATQSGAQISTPGFSTSGWLSV